MALTREDAWKKFSEWTQGVALRIHGRTVEIAMRAAALRYGEGGTDIEPWGIAGLLHDADYEKWPDRHPQLIVEWLREQGYAHATQILPHDVQVRELGTGKSRKEMLEEAGLEITVAPRLSVADGIQTVRQLLPRCWFSDNAKQGIDALRNYRREYDEKRAVFYDRPLHDWSSHAADAFRYLAIGLNEGSSSWDKPLKIDTRWVV